MLAWEQTDHVSGVALKHQSCFQKYIMMVGASLDIKSTKNSFAEAACYRVVLSTALLGLVYHAQLREGETVLIHFGSGGVGLAAIQVAKVISLSKL